MAAVYKALDTKLNRMVAVKILRDSYVSDPQFLARFRREAQQAASLNHPNIVRVFDVGDEGNIYYIVMEYIEGSSLKDVIIAEGPLSTQRSLELAAEICDAIGYAHSTGLIHRDIKPQNILLDRTGRVKVTDFGIAKSVNSATLTEAGITLGTVHYFSPEQAKGLPVLPQSDIYSIGIVLFEMLTGQMPFDSDNPVALALKHIGEPPPSPRRFNPSIPPVVEQIVLKTLAKEPNQRYASAEQLSRALRNLEAQSEQGTMAVRPAPGSNGFSNGRNSVVPPPATNYPPPPGATYVNPVRPVPPPQYDNYPYEGAQRSSTRYYNDGSNAAIRSRVPVAPVEYEDEPPRSSGGCLPWFVGGAAFLMVLALIVGGVLLLPQLTTTPAATPAPTAAATIPSNTPAQVAKVRVPAEGVLIGKTQPEAETAIKNARLQVGDIKQEFAANVPAGRIIATNPRPGSEVDVNTRIGLTVSRGAETLTLRDYFNTPPNDAQKQLEELGFKVERVEEFNDKVQDKAVIGTQPKAGEQVAKGSTVKLVISKGPPPPPTPLPTTAPPATTAPVVVPTTAPPPPPTTARPVQQVTVPQVVGRKRNDGQKALQDAGLRVRIVEADLQELLRQLANTPPEYQEQARRTYQTLKNGDILGTDPPGDTRVDAGREVKVLVKNDKDG